MTRVEVIDSTRIEVVTASQGPPGPPGSGLSFVHEQPVASDTWTITHNMNKYPSVVIMDTTLFAIDGAVEYVSLDAIEVTFNSAVAGKAVLN